MLIFKALIEFELFRLQDPIKGPEELKPFDFVHRMSPDAKNDEKSFAERGFYIKYGPDILKKMRSFTKPQRFVNQSYCSGGLKEIEVKEVLFSTGPCFTTNYDEKMMNTEE